MPEYDVIVADTYTVYTTLTVRAEDEQDACQIAERRYEDEYDAAHIFERMAMDAIEGEHKALEAERLRPEPPELKERY